MNDFGFGTVWILATALTALVLGFLSGWRTIRDKCAPRSVDDALLWWDEDPVSAFRQDPFVALLLVIHGSAIGVMGILAVLIGMQALSSPPSWLQATENVWSRSGTIWLVYYAGVALSAGLAWHITGATLVLPIANRRLRPVRLVLTDAGVYRGQLYMPWEMFGCLRQDTASGLIHLHSRRSPGLVVVTLHPPTGEMLSRAHEIIGAHIHALPESHQIPWYRRKAVFGLLFVLTALPIPAVGLWVYPSSAIWVWASQGIGAWLAAGLGAVVIRAYH
jgi:hypothetical protein